VRGLRIGCPVRHAHQARLSGSEEAAAGAAHDNFTGLTALAHGVASTGFIASSSFFSSAIRPSSCLLTLSMPTAMNSASRSRTPTICLDLRMALNGAADPWPAAFLAEVVAMLQARLATWAAPDDAVDKNGSYISAASN